MHILQYAHRQYTPRNKLSMLSDRTLKTLASYLVMLPLLSIYLFHTLGIPGLLQHAGACGWGMCSPTAHRRVD
jgi:hypothetical protein